MTAVFILTTGSSICTGYYDGQLVGSSIRDILVASLLQVAA